MSCVELRRLGPEDWRLWRGIRLRALADSPEAFGSTLARERAFTEAEWRRRTSGLAVLALVDGAPVALGGGYGEAPGPLHVIAMWVDPAHRGRGLGALVLDEVVASARAEGRGLVLDVVRDNAVARRAYRSRGFRPTGETSPLRPGSAVLTERMVLP